MSLGRYRRPESCNRMKLNNYCDGRFTAEDMAEGKHRTDVGGMWEELGTLQFAWLMSAGLKPAHRFLDIGCGCLRGGVHFIGYLKPGHYYGIDVDSTLLQAGVAELKAAGIPDRAPHLRTSDQFDFGAFAVRFDFALAFSVFTHLPINNITRCMAEAARVLAPEGKFFATYFEAPASVGIADIQHSPEGIVTHFDRDPYHYSREEIAWMARRAGLHVRFRDDFVHPRKQKMCELSLHGFTRTESSVSKAVGRRTAVIATNVPRDAPSHEQLEK